MIKDDKRKITFVTEDSTYEQICKLAAEQHRSVSNLCSWIISLELKKYQEQEEEHSILISDKP